MARPTRMFLGLSCVVTAAWLTLEASSALSLFIIDTAAGTGSAGYSGDGGPATAAQLRFPNGVALDDSGNLFVADTWNNVIRRVDARGTITTYAGTGVFGYSGDNGPAVAARLSRVQGLALDAAGNLYVADLNNRVVRKITSDGIISTVAGNGLSGYSGDGGAATQARFRETNDVWVDRSGQLYVADCLNDVVRLVDTTGTITTFAGTGARGFGGDNVPATSTPLNCPNGVVGDDVGNTYIADSGTWRVRRVDNAGTISTIAGIGSPGFGGDGGPAALALLNGLSGLALDEQGTLFVTDSVNRRVRAISPGGLIRTAVGTGVNGYDGDAGPATAATVSSLAYLATDTRGRLALADHGNHAIRIVAPANRPPWADAGSDQTAECTDSGGTVVTLNGAASTDPDGDPLTFTWNGPFGLAGGSTADAIVEVELPLGEHEITLTVMDDSGEMATDVVRITIVDTSAPEIDGVDANPGSLWPPNHRMVGVLVSVDVSDDCSGPATCHITAVRSNEPVDGKGDGNTSPDWRITGDLTLDLRAERSGRGDGRVYNVTLACTDTHGNRSEATVDIVVPKNRRE